jgi:hypothetical protein
MPLAEDKSMGSGGRNMRHKKQTGAAKRVSVRLNDSVALRLLLKPALTWRGEEPPRSSSPQWQALQPERFRRQNALVSQLAREFRIQYKQSTRKFWLTFALCLLDLFPAHQIRWETRGRGKARGIPDTELKRIAAAGPADRKRLVGEVADQYRLADATVARMSRRHGRRART